MNICICISLALNTFVSYYTVKVPALCLSMREHPDLIKGKIPEQTDNAAKGGIHLQKQAVNIPERKHYDRSGIKRTL